jgi:ribosome biogenesis GTPase / thiamine phosphate phosphatase
MTRGGPTLCDLGWDARWASLCTGLASRETPGRVIGAGRLLLVQTDERQVLAHCPPSRTPRPVCGDWVVLTLHADTQHDAARASVCATLPRRNAVVRQAADGAGPQALVANVDAIWLVCGLDRDQGLRSLARYQALTRLEQVAATIVLNKLDRCADLECERSRAQAQAPDLDVVAVSAHWRRGFEELESRLSPGRTTALIGPSGVGKSTLINALVPALDQRTHAVRQSDCRGRHTTSAARLVATTSRALLIDTPGLRELGLWQPAGFDNSYADILELAQGCRFGDCRHDREPGCRIREALDQGHLSSERFLAYLELANERTVHASRANQKERPRRKVR